MVFPEVNGAVIVVGLDHPHLHLEPSLLLFSTPLFPFPSSTSTLLHILPFSEIRSISVVLPNYPLPARPPLPFKPSTPPALIPFLRLPDRETHPLCTPPLTHRQFSLTENRRLLLRRLPTVSILHLLLPLLPMFSQEQSVSLKRPARPIAQYPSNPYRSLTGEPSSLIFPPFLSLSLSFRSPSSPFSSPPHPHSPLPLHTSTTACHTLIHSPRALTKQSLPVSPSHPAQATPALLLLSTPSPLPVIPSSTRLVP